MKRIYNLAIVLAGICLFAAMVITGCSKDNPLQKEVTWKKVCTEWGEVKSDVMSRMQKYERLSYTSSPICYKGKDEAAVISYSFVEDSLCAAIVLVEAESVDMDALKNSFKSLEYLGENNSMELFVDTSDNTLVTISECRKNDRRYYAVGYAAID